MSGANWFFNRRRHQAKLRATRRRRNKAAKLQRQCNYRIRKGMSE